MDPKTENNPNPEPADTSDSHHVIEVGVDFTEHDDGTVDYGMLGITLGCITKEGDSTHHNVFLHSFSRERPMVCFCNRESAVNFVMKHSDNLLAMASATIEAQGEVSH